MFYRTSPILLLLVLAPASAVVAGPPSRSGERQETIPIALFDAADLSPQVLAAARREASRILAAAEIVPYWLDPEPGWVGGECELPRVIVRRKIPRQWGLPRHSLGVTLPGDPSAGTVYLFSEAIRDALASSRRPGPVPGSRLGRALGRVLAHEVVHAISPTTPHADRDVMAPEQDRGTLLAARAVLDRRSVEALRRAVAGAQSLCTLRAR